MKKYISLIMILVLCITVTAGCQKSDRSENGTQTKEEVSGENGASVISDTAEGETTKEGVNTAKEGNTVNVENSTAASPESSEAAVKKDINVAALKGPTAMGMVKIMDDAKNGLAANKYQFTVAGAPDEITAGIVSGKIDIAAIPCNLAAVLYNKSKGAIVTAGINTLGVLYVVETGKEINSVADLKGKTIYSTGKGTTPEYTLNYLLSSYGLDPGKDVKVEYKSEATEVAAILSKSANAIALLPQPYVTTVMMNNQDVRIALDVSKEWDKVSNGQSSVVSGVIVVNKKFLESNKEAVDTFLSEYEASAQYVNSNPSKAADLIEKFDIFKAAPAKNALPYCNITYIQGEDMKAKIGGYLKTLFDQNPDAVGGTLPDDGFYYIKQ
jgi:NitT/TauT family transport system substrate-binding protein